MTRLVILEPEVDRKKDDISRDVRPDDRLACLQILRDRHKELRLNGNWEEYRIRAWDQRKGWIEHRA